MRLMCLKIIVLLYVNAVELKSQYNAVLILKTYGCDVVCRATRYSLVFGSAFDRVEGVRIDSTRLKRAPEDVFHQLRVFGALDFLSIDGLNINNKMLENLNCTVRKLNITNSNLNDEQLTYFSKMTTLEYVNISDNPVSGRGLSKLRRCPIRSLCLARTGLRPEYLRAVNVFVGLEELILDGTCVDDSALSTVRGLKNLRLLDVNETRVGNDGLKWVRSFGSLEILSLNGTEVDDKCINILHELPHLSLLSLGLGKYSDEAVSRLRRGRPGLFIMSR